MTEQEFRDYEYSVKSQWMDMFPNGEISFEEFLLRELYEAEQAIYNSYDG